jgi:hypothetical protein
MSWSWTLAIILQELSSSPCTMITSSAASAAAGNERPEGSEWYMQAYKGEEGEERARTRERNRERTCVHTILEQACEGRQRGG